jgi:aspartyl-tRNA(Asn)/glutamyl-tRNA(Gln) amidotransferase subunit A
MIENLTMTRQTISDAGAALRAGRLRSIDLVDASLDAIARLNKTTNAFIRVDAEEARAQAAERDRELAQGHDRGPLHGIPISLKDLVDEAGRITTAASRVLADNVASADATIVTRLREAGAISIGKTNMHEFALGTTSEDSAFGAVRNPLDLARSAGGSSGGAAVAVATGMGLAAIGSDTGGSIRIPSACCGIVGLKPSFGEVPIDGVVALSKSFDHVGPLALSVQDAAIVWAALTNRPVPPAAPATPAGLQLCTLDGYFDSPLAPEVRAAFDRALGRLGSAGVTLLHAPFEAARIPEIYVNTVLPEAAHFHQRWLDSHRDAYSPTVRARLEAGRSIPAVAYLAARLYAASLRHAIEFMLERCDALVLPTLPIVAPPLGAGDLVIDPELQTTMPVRSAMLKHTQPFNLSGHPAISLPIESPGLPVGLQLVGRLNQTERLLGVAGACEKIVK